MLKVSNTLFSKKYIFRWTNGNIKLQFNTLTKMFSGILITGGISYDGDAQHTAEVWLPNGRSCLLPRLPDPGRIWHTQSSLTSCGGNSPNCITFIAGEWELSHSLAVGVSSHVSWQSTAGILIMGGTSSELLSTTSDTTTPGFSLPYET